LDSSCALRRHVSFGALWSPCVALWLVAAPAPAQLELPTPLDHYETYDLERAARELALQVMSKVPEEKRAPVMELLLMARSTPGRKLTAQEARTILERIQWKRWRPQIVRLLLHASRILEVVPDSHRDWLPLTHDCLLLFLDRLSDERLIDRLVDQVNLPPDASRGERILAFISRTPSLQKLAQIIARNATFAPDIRHALQTVENGLATVSHAETRALVESDLGEETIARFQLQFADHVLAEASVGAVLPATFTWPGSATREDAVCKVLKPEAISAMREDLQIIDEVLAYLERNRGFYRIGDAPLVDMFVEVRNALSREVRVEDERRNLLRAWTYYQDDDKVVVPEVYPFSTAKVTCMQRIWGRKITDAFPGQPRERARLARRLSDALTFDVIFSTRERALFHGDPHAGNVFHVEDSGKDPYRIALLDWGLCAEFSREDRRRLVQLLVGLQLGDGKRLAENIDVVLDRGPRSAEARQEMRKKLEKISAESAGAGWFEVLDQVLTQLAAEGYAVRYEAAIFIKAQLTIAGILKELDPTFEQDKYVMSRLSGQVFKELPIRLLRTVYFPAWNSHDYRSMLSNEDVKDVELRRVGHGLKKVVKGIWYVVGFKWLRSSKGPQDSAARKGASVIPPPAGSGRRPGRGRDRHRASAQQVDPRAAHGGRLDDAAVGEAEPQGVLGTLHDASATADARLRPGEDDLPSAPVHLQDLAGTHLDALGGAGAAVLHQLDVETVVEAVDRARVPGRRPREVEGENRRGEGAGHAEGAQRGGPGVAEGHEPSTPGGERQEGEARVRQPASSSRHGQPTKGREHRADTQHDHAGGDRRHRAPDGQGEGQERDQSHR
jgi:ubiquinone biosynthesis protein